MYMVGQNMKVYFLDYLIQNFLLRLMSHATCPMQFLGFSCKCHLRLKINLRDQLQNDHFLLIMVAIDMNPMPPKVIGRKASLHARGPSGLSKDLRFKKHPTKHLKEGWVKRKYIYILKWKREVCIVSNMMVITENNGL
jgi:hypothetical protein